MIPRSTRPIAIDLFSGAGGMSLGFEQAGFRVVAALDANPMAAETHKRNFPGTKTICEDIRRLDGKKIRSLARIGSDNVAVVFGGPPCQGFSDGGIRKAGDVRNRLLADFARLVLEIRPARFVLENVSGLLRKRNARALRSVLNSLKDGGYAIVEPIKVLNAKDFNVPQSRSRVFILGARQGLRLPTYPTPIVGSVPTVWDAISDLVNVDDDPGTKCDGVFWGRLLPGSAYARVLRGELRDALDISSRNGHRAKPLHGFRPTIHSDEVIKRFLGTPPGKREPVSRFLRLDRTGICSTLRAGTNADRGSFTAPRPIHPVFPRCIYLREAARLHSFPDWFHFHDSKWHGFMQVGNSVPPRLARAVAYEVRKAMISADV